MAPTSSTRWAAVNDPIAAQGANLGSRCAFVLGAMVGPAKTEPRPTSSPKASANLTDC
ncbi:MAG: hypothetical protein JO287_01645 [Pseudonocardiales bacterium]|nr:hypothetical protein [Pseudonocardiales bacterium]